MPIYKHVNKRFFKKWTPQMAYILGFFAADGSMGVNKRGANYFSIQICDYKLLKEIKAVIKADHKISTRKGKERGTIEISIDCR
ncbi:MAG: hypothetical protein HZC03_01735 [Candidatus Lloydbacteria bacterium]|nr:hypothetical protein [Candidatus Lloydbacteria bacterium]